MPSTRIRSAGAALAAALFVCPGQARPDVTVEGNVLVDATWILGHVDAAGGVTDGASADAVVKSLFATGLFEDVSVSPGPDASVMVKERPRVSAVAFEGNARLDDSVLAAAAGVRVGDPLQPGGLTAAEAAVASRYAAAARPDAVVKARAVPSGTGTVKVVLSIDEKRRVGVEALWFEGNEAFSDATLGSVVRTRPTGLFSRLTGTDAYDLNKLEADREAIKAWYVSKGYADVRVSAADVDRPAGRGFSVGFRIEEGPRYVLDRVTVDSTVGDFPIRPRLRSGDVLSPHALRAEAERLADAAFAGGIRRIAVIPRVTRHADGRADVEFHVDRAGPAYVERIEIEGNHRTRDVTLLRELDFAEGDAFDTVLVRRARKRLEATGHFDAVRIVASQGASEDRVRVTVAVRERKSGELSVGGGYSTKDGPIANLVLGDTNLSGTGRAARASVTRGDGSTAFSFAFREPALLGTRASGRTEAFHTTGDRSAGGFTAYREDRTGGSLSVGLPVNGPLSLTLSYSAAFRNLSAVDPRLTGNGSPSTPDLVRPGSSLRSSLGYALSYDGREAGKGFVTTFAQDVAGLGGDVRQLKTEVTAAASTGRLPSGVEATLSGRAGHLASLGGEIAFPDHFRAGPDFVRGFAMDGFGPRDGATGYHLGGTAYAQATAEVTFALPLLPEAYGFRGAAFVDAGSVWRPDGARLASSGSVPLGGGAAVRASAGTGVLWESPFGLLRADFAWPIASREGDREQVFSFSGGTRF